MTNLNTGFTNMAKYITSTEFYRELEAEKQKKALLVAIVVIMAVAIAFLVCSFVFCGNTDTKPAKKIEYYDNLMIC